MKTILIILSVLAAEAIILVVFVNLGLYNVSTLSPDPVIIKWIFSNTSDNSAEHYSKGVSVPPLNDPSMIDSGFRDYHDICETCHGAPGLEKTDIAKGLYPHPPNLVNSAKELAAARLFWVIKNGIKSTGMPGFGRTFPDARVWAIVAFLEKMKNMKAAEYAAIRDRLPRGR